MKIFMKTVMKAVMSWMSRKRLLTLIGIVGGCLLAFSLYVPITTFINRHTRPDRLQITWMNIFVHGSFGSLLGFLSFSDVLSDKVSGTIYRDTTKKMRMDDFFFKDQPILQRGLHYVDISLDSGKNNNRNYAIYPICKAFAEVAREYELEAFGPEGRSYNMFYAFGWSGLISQNSRRYEAIRLHNVLVAEIKRIKALHIPNLKVRLIAHSHGGNLCLNLAAIKKVLNVKNFFDDGIVFSADADEQASLTSMATLLKGLTTKEIASTKVDQKAYDYLPESNDLIIDQLVMMGTPIQPETESFCYASMFKEVYNLYSDEDYVQRSDWVSSKKSVSSARITKKPNLQALKSNDLATLYQGQIITKLRPVGTSGVVDSPSPQKTEEQQVENQNVFQQLLSGKNIFVRKSADPTHKELWFFNWDAKIYAENPHALPCAPLPVVAFLPLILHAFKTPKAPYDAVILMSKDEKNFTISIGKYKTKEIVSRLPISTEMLRYLQENVRTWAPRDTSGLSEFEVINKIVAP